MKRTHDFKNDESSIEELLYVDPALLIVRSYFIAYCSEYNLPAISTSIFGEAKNRISQTHAEGRAEDFSVKSVEGCNQWVDFHIHRVQSKLNNLFASRFGTRPDLDSKLTVIKYHDSGSGPHFHLQVRRGIKIFV